eukprot:1282270-Pyramimonas_sp.AAC.2
MRVQHTSSPDRALLPQTGWCRAGRGASERLERRKTCRVDEGRETHEVVQFAAASWPRRFGHGRP